MREQIQPTQHKLRPLRIPGKVVAGTDPVGRRALGILLAIVFGAANAYLGLKIGSPSASIPAAVISMGILRGLFRRNSILENNIVQTMTTAGEAIGAGAVFTLPALFLWTLSPSQAMIVFIVLTGGFLGVFMMVPLRRLLIVNDITPCPIRKERPAPRCSNPEKRRQNARLVAGGFGGRTGESPGRRVKLFKMEVETQIANLNAVIGIDTFSGPLGVGYLIGPRIAGQMLAGGLLGWLVLIPMISFFGADSEATIFPAEAPIADLDAWGIWQAYITYIGAGAVAMAGLITMVKTLPTLVRFHPGYRPQRPGIPARRTNPGSHRPGHPLEVGRIGPLVVVIILAFAPITNVGMIGALSIAVFGFLFVAVASRIVGIVGSSSSPVSGMTIATILIVTFLFKISGMSGLEAWWRL